MTPGELFAKLWIQVAPQTGAIIAMPWRGRSATECAYLTELIRQADRQNVPNAIETYLAGEPIKVRCDLKATALDERAFVVMCALDDAAMDIHPSMRTRALGRTVTLSTLLLRMKQSRMSSGVYGEHEGHRVLPKGRLTIRREVREIDWASGANLETQFEYLTVLQPTGDRFSVDVEVVPPHLSPTAQTPQYVGIAPIAEDADDLLFASTSRGSRPYLDARPRDVATLQLRLIESVFALLDRGAELIVLPELVTPEAAALALSEALRTRKATPVDAIIVCGTGLTTSTGVTGLHFNEAVVMNGRGVELFRQRKIHPFNMGNDRMSKCGLAFASGFENQAHMEDIESDTVVRVRDLHGAGRMMVTICEDFEQDTPMGATALAMRPDWMITPVLDISQKLGRWTHQRSIELGRKTGSQVVVSCSASLTVREKNVANLSELAAGDMGLAILYAGSSRNVRIVDASEGTSSPRSLVIEWDPDNWLGDSVGAAVR